MIIPPAPGQHDDLLLPVVQALPPGESDRWLHEFEQHGIAFRQAVQAMRDGMRVAPYYRLRPAEMFRLQAERCFELGDPTAPAWVSMAELQDLRDEFSAIVDRLEMTDPQVD